MFALDFRFAVAAYQRHSSATLSNAKLATSFPFYVSGREDGFLRYLGAGRRGTRVEAPLTSEQATIGNLQRAPDPGNRPRT